MGRNIMILPALWMRRELVHRVLTRRGALAVLALVIALGAAVVIPARAEAAVSCRASYSTASQWPNGWMTNLTVTNTGDPLPNWVIGIVFGTPGPIITQAWNGSWTQSGSNLTGRGWGPLPTGGSVTVGFVGSGSTVPHPTLVTLNGVPCSGVGGPRPV